MASKAAVALACALSFWGASAAALAHEATATTRVAARELAVAGAEAYEQGDYAKALDRFQRAEQLYKVPSIMVMVARCLARSGRVVEAVDKYEETLRMPLDSAAPEAFQRAVSDSATEVEAVRARVARLELHLGAAAPSGAQVLIDERPVPPALLGVGTPVDPGAHRVTARAPGKAPYRIDLSLAEGERQRLNIDFAPAPPAPSSGAEEELRGKLRASPTSITLLAGGGLALAIGTVTGIAALNHHSALESGCSPGCPPRLREDLDAFRLYRTVSYLSLGIGVAAVGTGAVLLWRDSSGRQVGALGYPGGAFVAGRF